jgi:NADH-quinone oxidoreductase subunit J
LLVLLAFVAIVLEIVVILVYLNYEFLAYILLAVYIGAIVVLFLFFTMLASIQIQLKNFSVEEKVYFIAILMVCVTYMSHLIHLTIRGEYSLYWIVEDYLLMPDLLVEGDSLYYLAFNLYYEYFIIVVVLILLLLVALVAPILLTLTDKDVQLHTGDSFALKKQNIAYQINRTIQQSLKTTYYSL